VILGFGATLSAFGGETYTKGEEKLVSRVTFRGWFSLTFLIAAFAFGIVKEVVLYQQAESRINKDEQFKAKIIEKINHDGNKLESYQKILESTYQQVYSVNEKDAKKWADTFFLTLPIKKESLKSENELKKVEKNKQKIRSEIALKFAISQFDNIASSFTKRSNGLVILNHTDDFYYYKKTKEKKTIRSLVFPNGNKLIIDFENGIINDDQVTSHPQLICYEESLRPVEKKLNFRIYTSKDKGSTYFGKPLVYNIRYDAYINDPLTDQYIKNIESSYKKSIEIVYFRQNID
jgi:hypothetical protein